jgi:signal peptidase I
MSTQKKSVVRDWVESILVAFVLAMFIRTFIVQAFKIPTGSMRPTLLAGDIILVNKFVYGTKIPFTKYKVAKLRPPKRGDVVVFIFPEDPKKDFIKRMVGLPGDMVELKNGTIYVNDQPLVDYGFSQRYYYNRGDFAQEGRKIAVPAGNYFVLGDNSASSQDSRYWGFVPEKNILGEAMVIYWPPQRIRIIK